MGRAWTPLVGLAALAAAAPALAQAPSRVTPRDVRPAPQTPAQSAPPDNGLPRAAAPPGAETLSFTVHEVVVEGGFPELEGATARLTAPFRDRRITAAQLYDLAAAIEQLYAQAGYILVRVSPPPQSLVDGGTARLVVVDGFIEAIDTTGVPGRVRRPVEMYLKPLLGRRRLTQGQLERQVLLAGQVPGSSVTTALAKGQKAGGVKLVVNSGHDLLSGQVSLDNHLGEAFGKQALSVQWNLASAAGYGEQVYGFFGADPDLTRLADDHAPRTVVSLGVQFPLGAHGLIFNPEATVSRTYPRPPIGAPATYGTFDRYVLRASWPVILRRAYGLDAAVILEATDEVQKAYQFGLTLSHDELRIARLALDGHSGVFGPFSVRGHVELSRGFDGFGARTPEDAAADGVPLSRLGVTGDFAKIAAESSVAAPAPLGATVQVFVRGQAAIDGVLPSSELFALDGPTALSSFDSGATSADNGWTVRVQLGRAFVLPAWGGQAAINPYVYGAVGGASYETLSPGLLTRASDYGAGLDLRFAPPKGALRPFLSLELGRHDGNGLAPADSRFSVAAGVSF